jgi:hypothetical protein
MEMARDVCFTVLRFYSFYFQTPGHAEIKSPDTIPDVLEGSGFCPDSVQCLASAQSNLVIGMGDSHMTRLQGAHLYEWVE